MSKVYVSSTYSDLRECREQVRLVLRRMGHEDVAMEYYIAEDTRPVNKCLADVAACDLYVGIFAWRYGWIPKRNNADGLSITEMEYRRAVEKEKTCLIFLLDGKTFWPPDFVDDDRTRIKKLRDELNEKHGPTLFTSADNLTSQVGAAIYKWAEKQGHIAVGTAHPEFDLTTYYGVLRKRYQRLDLDALTPPQKEEYLQLQLRSVFVEQNVREDPPPVELPKEVWEKLREESVIREEDLPEGVKLEDVRRVEQFYKKPERPVLEVLTDPRYQRTVILGDPGSGKSTLARYVLLSLIDPDGDKIVRRPFNDYMPLLIELRSYAALCGENKCETFLEFLEYLGKTEGWHINRTTLQNHLKNEGRAVVIFDGMDEIFDPERREQISRQIAGFASDYPKVQIVVSSRIIGYRRKVLTDPEFAHFTLQDLDEPQVTKFVERWYALALSDRPDEAKERRERILRAFKESESIRQLAGNPMLLTIMAIIGKHQELPGERWKLYDHAASVLIQHWDVNKHMKAQRVAADFIGEDDKKELLRRLAYKMQGGVGGLAGNYIHSEQLQVEFENYLRERYGQTPDRAKIIAETMIQQFRERSFILSLYGGNLYGFVHRAFLEYFCATAFVHRFEKTREIDLAQLKRDVYGAHWEVQSWHEVLRLIGGMIDPKFAGEIIDYLSNEVGRPWPQEFGRRHPWNIALAVQCLREISNLSAIEPIAAKLLSTCCQLFQCVVNGRERSLAEFLERVIAPSAKSIGCRWPGREQIPVWLAQDVKPAMESFSGYRANHSCGIFVGSVGSDCVELREPLADFMRHPNGGVQCFVVHALSEYRRGHSENLDLLRHFFSNATYGVARGFATRYIAENWRSDPTTLPFVRRAVKDGDEDVRAYAVSALAEHFRADPRTVRLLRDRAVKDGDEDVRAAAVSALAERFHADPKTLPLLRDRAIKDGDEDVRAAAVSALAERFHADPKTLPLLRDRAINDESPSADAPDTKYYVREAAIEAIAEYWPTDPDTLPLLRERVENDPCVWLRKRARDWLVELSGESTVGNLSAS